MLSSSAATKMALWVACDHGDGYPRTTGAAGPPGGEAGTAGTMAFLVLGALRTTRCCPERRWRAGCLVLSVSWGDRHLPGRGWEASTGGAVPQGCRRSNICPSTCELFKRWKKFLKIRWIRVHWTLPFPLKQQAQRKFTNPGTACASSPGWWPGHGAEGLRTRNELQRARQGGPCPRRQCQTPSMNRRTWDELSS